MARKKAKARLMKGEKLALTDNDKLVLFYRENPVQAAKDLLGFDLIWLQRIILEEMWFKPFTCLDISRGVGKSFMIALYCVLKGMLYPNTNIGIITPVYRQVQLYIFGEIKTWYKQSPYFNRSVDGRITASTLACRIVFNNGSFVEGLPVGNDGGNIRGRRYHIVCADEYAQHDEKILKLVIRPMLNIKLAGRRNQYHIATTPYYKHNHFWPQYLHYIRMCMEKPDEYGLLEFDYRDVNMTQPSKLCPIIPYDVDEDILEMQRVDMTNEEFCMENLARFPDESSGFFTSRLLDDASPRRNPGPIEIEVKGDNKHTYYLGVDAGRAIKGSNFAVAIGKHVDGRIHLVGIESRNGATFQQMNRIIRELTMKFNVGGISVGQGGGGLTVKDLLAVPYIDSETGTELPPLTDPEDEQHQLITNGMPIVHIVNETQTLNNFMYATLKSDMEHERFLMPITVFGALDMPSSIEASYKEIQKTKTEFLVIEAVPTGTGFRFEVPDKYQKDRATACVLMNYLVSEKNKEFVPDEISLAEGFWVSI